MSLLNAWILSDEVHIAVDTDGVAQDGARLPSSKLLLITHLNAVIALRGQQALLGLLFMRCITSGFDSFDELDDAMPAMLVDVEALLPDGLIVHTSIGNEVLIAGWSKRAVSMQGRLYYKRDAMTEYAAATVPGRFISPWHESMQGVQIALTVPEKIARAQVRWMRDTFPGAACGGKLLMCHLTKKGTSISHKATFPQLDAAA